MVGRLDMEDSLHPPESGWAEPRQGLQRSPGPVLDKLETRFAKAGQFLLDVIDQAENVEAVVSIACGAGVQSLAERLPGKPIFPGINTTFIGETASMGLWQERCRGCGDCLLGSTAGLCPVTRCAKTLLNGPCGGSQNGLCEVSATLKCDVPCVWAMIYERLKEMGELSRLTDYCPPKDWRPSGNMGPRQMVRES